jgi:hypothetical protein
MNQRWTTVLVAASALLMGREAFGGELVLRMVRAQAGKPATVLVIYHKGPGPAAAGLATDIDFDSQVLTTPRCASGAALTGTGKTVVCSEVSKGRLRLGILGLDTSDVPEGEVARVTFAVDPGARPGHYRLQQHPTGADTNGRDISMGGNAGTVRIHK